MEDEQRDCNRSSRSSLDLHRKGGKMIEGRSQSDRCKCREVTIGGAVYTRQSD